LPKHSEGELLEAAARRAIAVVGNRRDPGPRWRARERARLQTLLEKWLDVERARAPFAVESIEQEAQVARLADLDFRVRIDRVDLLEDGARVLLDYKSGSVSSDWHGERPDNPQLPLYALLRPQDLVAVAYGRVNARDAGFVAESERRAVFAPRSSRSSLEGEPDFAALIGVWRARLESLAAAFAGGRAEVAPTLKACRSCHLQGFCRIPAALDDGLESP
jgi:RecB family exonuclease